MTGVQTCALPILLIASRKGIHNGWREDRIERQVGRDQLVRREVSSGQIVRRRGLVVHPVVVLVRVAEEQAVPVVEAMVPATVIAPVELWCWDIRCRLCR